MADPEYLDVLSSVALEDLECIDEGTPSRASETYRRWSHYAGEIADDAGLDLANLDAPTQERLIRLRIRMELSRLSRLAKGSDPLSEVSSAKGSAPQSPPTAEAPAKNARQRSLKLGSYALRIIAKRAERTG